MNATIVIVGLLSLIVLLLIIGAPIKSIRFMGRATIKIAIGVLFLFFFNVFGGYIGLHIPINIFTVAVSSILGVLGVVAIACIQILFL